MRRGVAGHVLAAAALTLAILSTGCGAGGSESPSENRGRMIENAYGETRVPEDPQSVVTLDPVALLNILALGERPVGYATPGASGLKLAREKLEGAQTVGTETEPSVEKVAALDPDLIVGYTQNPEEFSEIAPTVDVPNYDETDWKRLFRFYGEVLGKRNLADEKIAAFEAREKRLRGETGGVTVSFVRFGQGEVSVYPSSFSGSVLDGVGVERPANQRYEPGGECCLVLSAEKIPEIDADYIFVGVDPGGEETLAEYEENPLWARLGGEKISVDPAKWIQPSYPAADGILDDLEEHLPRDR